MPRARVVGLGVPTEALPGVLVSAGRAHVGTGAAVGEAAAAVRAGAGRARVRVTCHGDLLRSVAGAHLAPPFR